MTLPINNRFERLRRQQLVKDFFSLRGVKQYSTFPSVVFVSERKFNAAWRRRDTFNDESFLQRIILNLCSTVPYCSRLRADFRQTRTVAFHCDILLNPCMSHSSPEGNRSKLIYQKLFPIESESFSHFLVRSDTLSYHGQSFERISNVLKDKSIPGASPKEVSSDQSSSNNRTSETSCYAFAKPSQTTNFQHVND